MTKKSLVSLFAAAALAVPLSLGLAGTADAGFHSSFHPSFHSTYHPSFHSTPHITPHVTPHISEPHITPRATPHTTFHEESPATHSYGSPGSKYNGGWHNYWMWNTIFNHHSHSSPANLNFQACANDPSVPADQQQAPCQQVENTSQPTESNGLNALLLGGALVGGVGLGAYALTRRSL